MNRILIDLPPEIVTAIDIMAKKTQRTRKAMVQVLVSQALQSLQYKPQLNLTDELK